MTDGSYGFARFQELLRKFHSQNELKVRWPKARH